MNKTTNVLLGVASIALLAVLAVQQQQLSTMHRDVEQVQNDVEDIKAFLVQTNERIHYTKADVDCLSQNIYYEAGIEPLEGKYAVAQVTLNRLKTGYWGKSICKVVHAKAQFSWTLKKKRPKPEGVFWAESQAIARNVLKNGVRVQPLEKAIMYHASYVSPKWVDRKARITKIGQHIFYRNSLGQTLKVQG